MWQLTKEFCFEASHQLHGLPDGHPCGRVHGHSYRLVVVLEGKVLNEHGFVRDYRDLAFVKDFVDEHLDHRHLNDVFDSTTSEAIARKLFAIFKARCYELAEVRISETAKTWCTYRP